LWSQAVITEVYALHAFFCAALGLTIIVRVGRLPAMLILGGGLAHHPTFVLLLPAALYAWIGSGIEDKPASNRPKALSRVAWILVGSTLLAVAFYLRIPWVAGWTTPWVQTPPPPVLWGFPDNWHGFWWLVSGSAYHPFVLGVPLSQLHIRLWSALAILVEQYTAIGLLAAVVGFAHWRQHTNLHLADRAPAQPKANWILFSLLWILPSLLYATTYNTTDSYLYLLPVVWFIAVCAALGFYRFGERVTGALPGSLAFLPWLLLVLGLGTLLYWRWPDHSLRHDAEARTYIDSVTSIVTPNSIVVTRTDAHTFALWYAAWGEGALTNTAPGSVLLNAELYAYPWYQRLLATRYPHLVEVGKPLPDFIVANAAERDIWLAEPFPEFAENERTQHGALWRYSPPLHPTQD
jgi:hypothetical protein